MADIRTLQIAGSFGLAKCLLAGAGVPAGFTQGQRYTLVSLAVDNAAVPPAVWVLTIDDNNVFHAALASLFTYIPG